MRPGKPSQVTHAGMNGQQLAIFVGSVITRWATVRKATKGPQVDWTEKNAHGNPGATPSGTAAAIGPIFQTAPSIDGHDRSMLISILILSDPQPMGRPEIHCARRDQDGSFKGITVVRRMGLYSVTEEAALLLTTQLPIRPGRKSIITATFSSGDSLPASSATSIGPSSISWGRIAASSSSARPSSLRFEPMSTWNH